MGDITHQSLTDWQREVKQRLGDPHDLSNLAFTCGRCGNVATAQQFVDVGGDPDHAAQECLGRRSDAIDCDWAAFGLLGPLKGRKLTKPDGDTLFVFEFAEVPS